MSSLRFTRLTLTRIARHQACFQRRTFMSPTPVLRADLVQGLYIKELNGYKPTPVKPSDAEGHVQIFSAPKAPRSPEESDIANELKAYEDQKVEVEGQAATGHASTVEEDWFEDEEEEEAHSAH